MDNQREALIASGLPKRGSVLDGSCTTQKRLWLPMAFGQIRRICVPNDLWITQKSLYHFWLQDNPEEALSSFAVGGESSPNEKRSVPEGFRTSLKRLRT